MSSNYQINGVCAKSIDIDIDSEGVIQDVSFTGGCNGNLKAIGKLVKGKQASEIADILRGNTCGMRNTSCADRLSSVLDAELARMEEAGELA